MVVLVEQGRDSAIHIHVSILPQTSLPSRLPHNSSPMPNRSADTVMEDEERVTLFLCQTKGEHSMLMPQELCPHSLVNKERLSNQEGVCDKSQGSNSLAFFFLLSSFKRMGILTRLGCVQGLRWSPKLNEPLWSL